MRIPKDRDKLRDLIINLKSLTSKLEKVWNEMETYSEGEGDKYAEEETECEGGT